MKKEENTGGSVIENITQTKEEAENAQFKKLFNWLYTRTSYFGWYIFNIFCSFFIYIGKGSVGISKLLWRTTGRFRRYLLSMLKEIKRHCGRKRKKTTESWEQRVFFHSRADFCLVKAVLP